MDIDLSHIKINKAIFQKVMLYYFAMKDDPSL